MDIKDLLEDAGLVAKRKGATHGGEYCSPCPFCKDGDDRFLIWPNRSNKNGDYRGGRFSCRVCLKYGDAITFLKLLNGLGYKEACALLRIEPTVRNNARLPRLEPKPPIAEDPLDIWKKKGTAFVSWAHEQLMNSQDRLAFFRSRGFRDDSLSRFKLGFNPETLFRERPDWGLANEIKENGKPRMLWLPDGLVIPTLKGEEVIKVKIRRSAWIEGDKLPKYVEVSGSKQAPSIFGDPLLPCALVLESEIDSLLVQQEASDLVYCVALSGATKPLDADTDKLLRNTPLVLFLPDFDEAGAAAWVKLKKKFSGIQRILTPHEKSAGDYFQAGGNLRKWIEESIVEIQRKNR